VGGEIYNIYERPPKVEGICDNDGGELFQRPDDREDVIRERLHAYEKQTSPLVQYYRRLGFLHDIDADKSFEEVKQRMFESLAGIGGVR
jgi:adenylate kinase